MRKSFAGSTITRNLVAVIVLLTIVFLLVGCGKKESFSMGFGHGVVSTSVKLGVRSNTDVFDVDEVYFDFYYGIFDADRYKNGENPKEYYTVTDRENPKIVLALYVCEYEYNGNIISHNEFEDYKEIDNQYLLKEISDEEAFSEEYSYRMSTFRGVIYNHHGENLKLPKELFTKDYGMLQLLFISFEKPSAEGGLYLKGRGVTHALHYEKIDEDTVKISFW